MTATQPESSSIAPPGGSTCNYCGASFPSRNKLYAHLREATACGEQAVARDGLDLEARRPRRAYKRVRCTWGSATTFVFLWSPSEPFGASRSPLEPCRAFRSPSEPFGALRSPWDSFYSLPILSDPF